MHSDSFLASFVFLRLLGVLASFSVLSPCIPTAFLHHLCSCVCWGVLASFSFLSPCIPTAFLHHLCSCDCWECLLPSHSCLHAFRQLSCIICVLAFVGSACFLLILVSMPFVNAEQYELRKSVDVRRRPCSIANFI
jgi:hypothetical protein